MKSACRIDQLLASSKQWSSFEDSRGSWNAVTDSAFNPVLLEGDEYRLSRMFQIRATMLNDYPHET